VRSVSKMPDDGMAGIDYFLGVLDQMPLSSDVFEHASRIVDSHLLQPPSGALKASPQGPERFLTIAMATYDEYDATFFTLQSIRMYHRRSPARSPYWSSTTILVVHPRRH
jgi:hypothetical protein